MINNLLKGFDIFLIIAQGLITEEETATIIAVDKDSEAQITIED